MDTSQWLHLLPGVRNRGRLKSLHSGIYLLRLGANSQVRLAFPPSAMFLTSFFLHHLAIANVQRYCRRDAPRCWEPITSYNEYQEAFRGHRNNHWRW